MKPPRLAHNDPWEELRVYTSARIALGRVGSSLPTTEVLRFGLDHAQACDAVHHPLDVEALQIELEAAGFEVLHVASQAPDRHSYLLRPDLGRRLTTASRALLQQRRSDPDFAVVIADGLSAIAIQRHAPPLLQEFCGRLAVNSDSVPVIVAEQGRVALGDDIGEALSARLVIVLIGERPGLTAPDSLGIYLTFAPRVGRMDSERNCISNVRPQGLAYTLAADRLAYLVRESLRRQLSGIALKDDSLASGRLLATGETPAAPAPDEPTPTGRTVLPKLSPLHPEQFQSGK
ncbi:MAG: ethanolamine ammonia-lyase subunit EutC [Porticoccaceae bacterium]